MPKLCPKPFLFLVSCLLTLVSGSCFAQITSYRDSLAGPFTTGVNFPVQDPNYAASGAVNNSVTNTVALRVVDNVLISTPFSYTVSLGITYYTYANPTTAVNVNTSLTVNYTSGQGVTYKGLDVYQFTGAFKIVVTVSGTSVNGGAAPPAGAVQLSSDVITDRIYPFNTVQVIGATYVTANNGKQMQLSWVPVQGADEYDVEWTTINDGNANFALIVANINSSSNPGVPALNTALTATFRSNASRITQKGTSCNISLISTDSILLVRVRQTQYNINGVRIAGNWDYTNGSKYAIFTLNWNEQNQNWQYAAAYAEEGKKKEVISYFDGTLRGRQTTTLDNTDNVAIAQENIYDTYGRPTASILPAPYKEPSLTPYLHYIANFNVTAANTPYTYANVAGAVAAACELNPDSLSTLAGASRYYSNQNDFISLNIGNNYIPNASGFPLSVTQYTNDNTGRIQSQGGVGPAFQPGKAGSPQLSKTTKYYYGKPEQWELDQLFANDAGYAEHYLKNMVVDPNGQISVSYLNASGKTIATALTGTRPASLDSLPSYTPIVGTTKPTNIHILKPSQFIYNATALTLNANTTYTASVIGTDTLKFNIQQLVDLYPGGGFQICSNCYYKMTVKVTDDCGNITAAISTPVQIGSATSNCAGAGTYNGSLNVPVQQIGTYNISIQFAFDNSVVQVYGDNFIAQAQQNGYLQTQFNYIQTKYLDSINVSGCYSDCHSCSALLGSQTAFVQMLQQKCTALGLDSADVAGTVFGTWANGLYTTLQSNCTALLASCTYAPCTAIQSVMMDDVSPGGQYALFDSNGNALEPTINVLTETLPGAGHPNWRIVFPVLPSSNSTYQANKIVLPDSTITSPNDTTFTIQKLITYWQPAWANSFLVYHPEYCKLMYCQANSQYEGWDMVVQQDINTAATVPNIPTGGGTPLSYSYTNASDWLLNGDPFFKTGAPGHVYITQMDSDLTVYSGNTGRGVNIPGAANKGLMQFDDYILYCQDTTARTNTVIDSSSPYANCTPSISCRVADREWLTYRQYYFDLKQKYYTLLQNASCSTATCPVGQPVVTSLTGGLPVVTDFSVGPYTGTPSCAGMQEIVVTHNAGMLTQQVAVTLYYPGVTGTISLTFPTGTSQQTVCIPSTVSLNNVYVNAVYAGSVPSYGNDPTWVVTVTDQAGGPLNNDCHNSTFVVYNTVISLKDSHGNVVNAVNPVTAVVNYTYTTCSNLTPQNLAITLTIPAGQSVSAPNNYVENLSCDVPCHWGTKTININCVASLTNASNITGVTKCTGYTMSNPQGPAPGNCPAAYPIKMARFPASTSTIAAQAAAITSSSQLTGPQLTAIQNQASDICTGNAAAWISKLQPGLTAIGATQTQISQLTAALISICAAGGDQAHPMGASTLPPGQTGTYANFGAAIKGILLGSGNFTTLLNPWLIDAPYPYSEPVQSNTKTITSTNASLCGLLQTYTQAATNAGQTLYNYLVSIYGSAMTLSTTDVTNLQNACGNCRFLLATNVTLPVFLDPGAQGCIAPSAYQAAKTALVNQFGGTLPTTDPNYQTIYSNYMNQQWGFSLIYDNYAAYDALLVTNPSATLCNTLPYATTNADPYDCVKNAVVKAVNNGLADYTAYLAAQRQLFISSYINTCSLAQANANMVALQQEYHYTLYYYDQADNLVRTVPPEGVTLVNPLQFSFIDNARDNDTLAYTYTGPTTAASQTTAFAALSQTLSAAQGAVEMWLYNGGLSNYHWVAATPDNQYLFQVGIAGNYLNIDVFPMTAVTNGIKLVPATGHYQANIGTLQPLQPFTHVVFQGSTLGTAASLPQLYVNGTQLTVTNAPVLPPPVGFTITAGASSVTLPDSIQPLKHLLLYPHVLSQATITADAANTFFNVADHTYSGWYRFNVPNPGDPTTVDATTTNETTLYKTYPAHVLPTTYAYNSTNQVTQQNAPDGGTNRFWYDLLSRLSVSQNDKQLPANNYSYTDYDAIGRITEVGQKNQTTVNIGSPDYLAAATLQSFTAAGANSQITDTYYDAPVPTVSGNTNGIATLPQQSYLRKRVAASTYTETQGSPALRATYYNYDLDGNVKTLWQQTDGLYQNSSNTGLKRIDYEYDLVSGKVNFVRYQGGQPDAFYYRYTYDADNRITGAYSSTVAVVDTALGSYLPASIRKKDAAYSYYLHGPLQRLVLGDLGAGVQGVDYAYTLQGWLKGVNSTAATAAADMGQDGADVNHPVARDAYGYSLGYYTNDYKAIGGGTYTAFTLQYTQTTGDITGQSLYNGNITNATMAINQLGNPVGYTYHYDQLNRLKKMRQYTGISGTSWSRSNITLNYQENATYDGNGNILTYGRNGAAPTAQTIDSLTYNYSRNTAARLNSNKLQSINDAVATSNYTLDLRNQTNATNYRYDAIGNLIYDAQSNITGNDGVNAITWSVYGKIQSIYKTAGTISYTYNPAGQRVSKTAGGITTWYIRDAQGNTLAVYNNAHSNVNWREQDLYGSSRLGMWLPNVNLAGNNAQYVADTVGKKVYELDNHLANVLTTVSDKRLQHSTNGTSIDYFTADVAAAQDYYPFGMLMPGRQYTFGSDSSYRYGFNGKENDNEVKGLGNEQDYGMRIYDPRVGRFLSVDPLQVKYPELTPYQFASNSPIANIDLDGNENLYFQISHDQKTGKTIIKKEIVHFLLEKIMPYNVYFNINNSGYFYVGSYALSFEGQRKLLNQTIANYGKNPKEAIEYLKESKISADKRNQEDQDFLKNIWVDGYTTAWAVNRTNQPTSANSPVVEPEEEPMPNTQDQATNSTGITVTNSGESVPIYRGGNDFEVNDKEIRINSETGLVKPTHGLSLNISVTKVEKYGGAYQIESIPKGLQIIQRGKDPGHYEIVPMEEMSKEKFQNLLKEIKTKEVSTNNNTNGN